MSRHFQVDRSTIPQRDPQAEAESSRTLGFYQKPIYDVVPIDRIIPEKVWKDIKLQKVLEKIDSGKPLAPIGVVQKGGRYSITDGIHRYNASVQRGFTHIPVVKYVTVETPELFEQPGAEQVVLKPGEFVYIRDPAQWQAASPWAMVEEYLGPTTWRGAKRHRYALAGFEVGSPGEVNYIGDFMDEFLDTSKQNPPRDVVTALRAYAREMRIARMARRVATHRLLKGR